MCTTPETTDLHRPRKEAEAKDIQLQEKDTKMEEKDTKMEKEPKQLQILRVHNL